MAKDTDGERQSFVRAEQAATEPPLYRDQGFGNALGRAAARLYEADAAGSLPPGAVNSAASQSEEAGVATVGSVT
jgi:hypothetical protein